MTKRKFNHLVKKINKLYDSVQDDSIDLMTDEKMEFFIRQEIGTNIYTILAELRTIAIDAIMLQYRSTPKK